MPTDAPHTIYLEDYQQPEYLVESLDLTFQLENGVTTVTARSKMYLNEVHSFDERGPVHLHGENLELVSIKLNGEALHPHNYHTSDDALIISEVPQSFDLEIVTRIKPEENTSLNGLYKSSGIYCTQCEAEGFRNITYYFDRPDVMARYSTRIEADKAAYPVLLSNGNLDDSGDLDGGRHFAVWKDPHPKPSYLFALVAGDLLHIEDRYTTASGRDVALKIYVEAQNIDRCKHAMRSLQKAMKWDEDNYGREYDLDIYMIVAVNDFNMGAMENKGLNVFNSKYVLARPDTATDQDYQGIEGVIAHEYFHNWTGNRITCRDWFQLSLKEGLTVFRDQEFSSDMGSRGVKRIDDVRILRQHQFREDAGPMAHPVRPASYIEINNFYTVTVYNKGAEVLRMQHSLLGAEGYRKGTDLYFDRHDGQAVTTDDFVKCMEDANEVDFSQFRRWYSQAGTPVIHVTATYDDNRKSLSLRMTQNCPPTPGQKEKKAFHMPIRVGLVGADGKDIPLQLETETEAQGTSRVLEHRHSQDCFVFINVQSKPVASINRGFTAPVRMEVEYSDDDLMFLMANDSDDFNRWDAGQTLVNRIILGLVDRQAKDSDMSLPDSYFDAVRKALQDAESDKDFLAELIRLPSEASLAEIMSSQVRGSIDVVGIHEARSFVRRTLGETLYSDFLALYQANLDEGEYDIEPSSIGRRALKNICLDYLVSTGRPDAIALALKQFKAQANMTDVIAAMAVLVHLDVEAREETLASFYDTWKNDTLVMDKWFAMQAMSQLPDTLKRVKRLKKDPAFDMSNPNKVRSLIGAFCAGNQLRFHAQDGSGYKFLVDQLLILDPANPQIAARLLGSLAQWRKYDEDRQGLMKQELQRILAVSKLSKDCYEVASKSLES